MKKKRAKNAKRLIATALTMSLVIGGGASAFANGLSETEIPVVNVSTDVASQGDSVYIVDPLTQKFEVLVIVENEAGKQLALEVGEEVKRTVLFGGMELLTLKVNEEGFKTLLDNPNIKHAEKNVVIQTQDSSFSQQSRLVPVSSNEQASWGYEKMNFNKAWTQGYTGKGVKIAVLDSGVATHSELSVSGGISMVDYTTSYADDNGHGTHVMGILNAKHDNRGLTGVAPDAEVYAVKVIDQGGEGTIEDIAEGIAWAVQNDMDIINMSIGTFHNSEILTTVIGLAVANGTIVVASAGNEGVYTGSGENMTYPARLSSVISVGAVNEFLLRATFSSTGTELDIMGPGVDIVSTSKSGNYESRSGTSMATPFITGMVAILKEAYPEKTVFEIQDMIQKNATNLGVSGHDSKYGNGLATFNKFFEVASETPAVDPVAITNATTAVERAEKYKTSYYVNKAVTLVTALPDSVEKTQLTTRMQQLGAMKTATSTPTTTTPTTGSGVDAAQLTKATSAVERAEKYKSSYYVNAAVKEVNILTDSTEKDALIARMQKMGAMLDVQTTAPVANTEPTTTPGQTETPTVTIDPAALEKATKYVGFAEKYRSSFYLNKAEELINALPDSSQKTDLNNRLLAIK